MFKRFTRVDVSKGHVCRQEVTGISQRETAGWEEWVQNRSLRFIWRWEKEEERSPHRRLRRNGHKGGREPGSPKESVF